MSPEKIDLIRYRLERAREAINEARLLLDNGFYNTCINRLYYACFYVVSALLMTDDLSSSKHSGTRALFDRYWVKEGKVSVELGRVYRSLFMNRQKSDYEDLVKFKKEETLQWLKKAERFVREIEGIVQQRLLEE